MNLAYTFIVLNITVGGTPGKDMPVCTVGLQTEDSGIS